MAHGNGTHGVVERAVVLAFATLLCALLTMVVGVVALQLSLPPTDLAYGEPWFPRLVLDIAIPLALVGALLAYPFMLWGLLRTNLARSLPTVFATSIGAMAIAARFVLLGALFSLFCAIVAMAYCRRRFRDPATPNPA